MRTLVFTLIHAEIFHNFLENKMLETNYEEHDYKNKVSKGSMFGWPTLQSS